MRPKKTSGGEEMPFVCTKVFKILLYIENHVDFTWEAQGLGFIGYDM